MLNFYLDESGCMELNPHSRHHCFFHIAMVKVNNKELIKRRFKRFISKNSDELRMIDENNAERKKKRGEIPNRMFVNNKFKELKGSCLTYEMKSKFIDEICIDNAIDVYFITINNTRVNDSLYDNKARAFNFVLKSAFISFYEKGILQCDDIFLHCDNRNVKTKTLYLLEEYLMTELVLGNGYYKSFKAEYLQSENSIFVQIADIFANFHYSSSFNKKYKSKLIELEKNDYIKGKFLFLPPIRA